MKPSIASINRALDAEDFRQVSDFAEEACYSYGERDDDKHKPTGLTCDLDPEEDEDDTIVGIIESLIYARFPEIHIITCWISMWSHTFGIVVVNKCPPSVKTTEEWEPCFQPCNYSRQ